MMEGAQQARGGFPHSGVGRALLGAEAASAEKQRDTGEIGALLNRLAGAIGECGESAERLEAALVPILDQRPKTVGSAGGANVPVALHPSPGSQIGERLTGMLDRVMGLQAKLESLRHGSAL